MSQMSKTSRKSISGDDSPSVSVRPPDESVESGSATNQTPRTKTTPPSSARTPEPGPSPEINELNERSTS